MHEHAVMLWCLNNVKQVVYNLRQPAYISP